MGGDEIDRLDARSGLSRQVFQIIPGRDGNIDGFLDPFDLLDQFIDFLQAACRMVSLPTTIPFTLLLRLAKVDRGLDFAVIAIAESLLIQAPRP